MIYSAAATRTAKPRCSGNPTLNGIDYLEVLDHDADPARHPAPADPAGPLPERAAPPNLAPPNILIAGGESITDITVDWVALAPTTTPAGRRRPPPRQPTSPALPDAANVLVVRTKRRGRLLALHAAPGQRRRAGRAKIRSTSPRCSTGFDPQLAEVEFSFKVECPPDFDCAPQPPDCPPDLPDSAADQLSRQGLRLLPHGDARPAEPASAGLGRDHRSRPGRRAGRAGRLRRRPAQLPAGRGRHRGVPGDRAQPHLAAPPRAAGRLPRPRWLQRPRLDAASASTSPVFLDARCTRFYTFAPGMPSNLAVGAGNEEAALDAGVIVFEPMQDA